jgi:hypothetical protein
MIETPQNWRAGLNLPRPAHRSWSELTQPPRARLAPNEIDHLRSRFWAVVDGAPE